MSNYKISFIGGGNMAEAILSKALSSGIADRTDMTVCDISQERRNYLKEKYSIEVYESADDAVGSADIIFFAVKPQHFAGAVETFDKLLDGKAVVSIMAGVSIKKIKDTIKSDCRVLRVMPNTPALVGAGMSVLCTETDLHDDEHAFVKSIFQALGETEILSEKYIDAVTGVSGSGPAYVYMFIEAMADAGVLNGLPRDTAYKLAAQTVLGAGKMIIDTKLHPGKLKDMVSSPGGTTIEAVASLEKDGLRNAVINAVNACTKKSKSLGKATKEKSNEKN